MKLSDDWADFKRKIDQLHPRYDETMALDFGDFDEKDPGKGL